MAIVTNVGAEAVDVPLLGIPALAPGESREFPDVHAEDIVSEVLHVTTESPAAAPVVEETPNGS